MFHYCIMYIAIIVLIKDDRLFLLFFLNNKGILVLLYCVVSQHGGEVGVIISNRDLDAVRIHASKNASEISGE